jgi:hypothetical protein
LNKWVSTVSRKARRWAKTAFKPAETHRNDLRITAHRQGISDPRLGFESCQRHNTPSPVLISAPSPLNVITCLEDGSGHGSRPGADATDRLQYLLGRENCPHDIAKLDSILRRPHVLLEIGCGNAEVALQIALKNPGIGVVATDLYDCSAELPGEYCYGRVARKWRDRQLPAQIEPPANLVILRAETGFLHCLPPGAVDTVFLINPEPLVGKAFLALLQMGSMSSRIKKGPMQVVILPYSRKLGLAASGGCSFNHDPDWSRGLGFIMGSGLRFERGEPVQWGVDLTRISPFTKQSTQKDIYIYGAPPWDRLVCPTGQESSQDRQ